MDIKNTLGWAIVAVGIVLTAIALLPIALPPSEEQVNVTNEIQEEELEVIGSYKMGAFLSVCKIHDNKDNVTCWLAFSGISCIPDHMLSP